MLPPISIILLIAVTLHTAHLIAHEPTFKPTSPTEPSSANLAAHLRGAKASYDLNRMAQQAGAEGAWRNQMSGFRWAQGRNDDSAAAAPQGSSGFFGNLGNSLSGYVPLRSAERTNEEEAYLSLSRWERLLGFMACLAGSAMCFFFAFLFLNPVFLATRPHKFALAFSLGSLLFMIGFAILTGPMGLLKTVLSAERLPFSASYFLSLGLTIYFAMGPRWMLPTLIAAIVQVCALLAFTFREFPGGLTTLRYGGSMILRGGASLLPI